jgi:hypothetical protein
MALDPCTVKPQASMTVSQEASGRALRIPCSHGKDPRGQGVRTSDMSLPLSPLPKDQRRRYGTDWPLP